MIFNFKKNGGKNCLFFYKIHAIILISFNCVGGVVKIVSKDESVLYDSYAGSYKGGLSNGDRLVITDKRIYVEKPNKNFTVFNNKNITRFDFKLLNRLLRRLAIWVGLLSFIPGAFLFYNSAFSSGPVEELYIGITYMAVGITIFITTFIRIYAYATIVLYQGHHKVSITLKRQRESDIELIRNIIFSNIKNNL